MPYDPGLAERLEETVSNCYGMIEKKMFGGIIWMLNGNMCAGVYKDWLIIRVGLEASETLLREPHVKPMDITGKAMKGWAMVDQNGLMEDHDLEHFCTLAINFVQTLPEK